MALAPVVADRVREDRTGAVEGGARNRPGGRLKRLEARARILVPEVDCAVGSYRPKRSQCESLHKDNRAARQGFDAPHVENVPWTGWKVMSFTA